ncbi:hypothetical protein [Pseudomarimonas salicorniae]|uniref:Periplasmic heavy metal sensor n=1 Tax=Pseudomarimonas salicorniae TaxID=2933270 RepID=A0ABT0GNL2_9GAMM|nr:hypothetical protein [Lysobacter sp. CAU 1642]MCK7595587.1 hypothetical protein [Lysobacter sp. CAU 1642]
MQPLMLRLALAAATLSAGLATAADDRKHSHYIFSPSHFEAQREAIIEDMRGRTYRELSDEDRDTVLAALERMAGHPAGVSRFEELDKRVQTTVFNDQELVNNLLTQAAADSRLICKREKFVGSHRTTNICLTVAERRRLTEAAQNQMGQLQGSGYLPREPPPGAPSRPGGR